MKYLPKMESRGNNNLHVQKLEGFELLVSLKSATDVFKEIPGSFCRHYLVEVGPTEF